MNKLRNFLMLLALLCLMSCDDKAAKPATQRQQGVVTPTVQSMQDIEQLQARLVNSPEDFHTLSALADMYFESARYIDAFNLYDKAIAVNPNCADCFNDRGLSLFYLGDPTSALESFDKAIALNPEFIHAWLSKGFVLISEGRYQEAVAPLNRVKQLDTTGVLALQADKFLAMAAEKGPQ